MFDCEYNPFHPLFHPLENYTLVNFTNLLFKNAQTNRNLSQLETCTVYTNSNEWIEFNKHKQIDSFNFPQSVGSRVANAVC